jgi:hypothetical protein
VARITVATDARSLRWEVVGAGAEREPAIKSGSTDVPSTNSPFHFGIPTSGLATGVYLVRLTADDGRTGFAPFIVPPGQATTNRVAVVMPTYTWQAYNFEDVNGDGWGDTWYAGWFDRTARIDRHYMGWGMPMSFRRYDLPYLGWLARRRADVDYLSDEDFGRLAGARLARAYDLIIFPGHHEYVTAAEFRAVKGFRDRGGNVMLLAANNFYWRLARRGAVIERTARWRDLGHPEAAILGTQYRGNDGGRRKGPWRVLHTATARWLWFRTGLVDGSLFGLGGIEIDSRSPSSPRGTVVLAEIPQLYGPRFSAQMTYYETPRGAKVFSAGAFMFTRSVWDPVIAQLLTNLWNRMVQP